MNQIFLETRMFWLLDGEEIMTLAFFRFDTIPECDGQTDGRTDIPPLAILAVCIARYANALVKSDSVSSTPQGPGEIEMFRGEGVWGNRRGWVWGGAGDGLCPSPTVSLGAVPPENFLNFSNKY